MNILAMLWKNVWGGSRTLLFPARPKVGARYRGLVRFDPALCTGCAMCRFRCTARAIEFRAAKAEFEWSYDPGHCTFCGRCVEGCNAHALSQESACPPIYLSKGQLKVSHILMRKPPVKPGAATQTVSAGNRQPPAPGGQQ